MTRSEYLKKRRNKLKEEGTCINCGNTPAEEGKSKCAKCQGKHLQQQKRFREKMKKEESLLKTAKVITVALVKAHSPALNFAPIVGTNTAKVIALAERVSSLARQRVALASVRPWWELPHFQDYRNLYKQSPAPVSSAKQPEKGR